GNIIALASGISFAGIAVCLRMQKGTSTLESLMLGHILTAAVGIPFLLNGSTPTKADVIKLTILGIFQLGIPYMLYGIAIKHVTPLEATLIPVIEPILNPIWVLIFMNERPTPYAIAGGAVVISAVLWHSTRGKNRIIEPA